MTLKCEKCGIIEEDYNKMIVPGGQVEGHIDTWLCLNCYDKYLKDLEIFHEKYIQPERSKREDPK